MARRKSRWNFNGLNNFDYVSIFSVSTEYTLQFAITDKNTIIALYNEYVLCVFLLYCTHSEALDVNHLHINMYARDQWWFCYYDWFAFEMCLGIIEIEYVFVKSHLSPKREIDLSLLLTRALEFRFHNNFLSVSITRCLPVQYVRLFFWFEVFQI